MKFLVLLSIISLAYSASYAWSQNVTVSGSFNSGTKSCSLAIRNTLILTGATSATQ